MNIYDSVYWYSDRNVIAGVYLGNNSGLYSDVCAEVGSGNGELFEL